GRRPLVGTRRPHRLPNWRPIPLPEPRLLRLGRQRADTVHTTIREGAEFGQRGKSSCTWQHVSVTLRRPVSFPGEISVYWKPTAWRARSMLAIGGGGGDEESSASAISSWLGRTTAPTARPFHFT
ncbi:hypothetical protein B296_00051458, partial [Ensete ventricosum]